MNNISDNSVTRVHTQDCGTQVCSSCANDTARKEIKEVKVKLPANVRTGDIITVTVSNSNISIPTPPATNLAELLSNFAKGYRLNQMVVRVSTPKKVYYYRGKELTELPSSQLQKLIGGGAVIWQSVDYTDTAIDTPYILAHGFTTQIKVK